MPETSTGGTYPYTLSMGTMSNEFPQVWYRPGRWSSDVVPDELLVHRETADTIWVQERGWAGAPFQTNKDGTPKLRMQRKNGARPSLAEALQDMLESAKRSEQSAQDSYSRAVQRRKEIAKALADITTPREPKGEMEER